jgi:hypothetical protein
MGTFHDLGDGDIERILSGVAPPARPELADLAARLEDARRTLSRPPGTLARQRHVAAIEQASRTLAVQGTAASSPASKAGGSAPQASGLVKWRRVMNRTRSIALKLGVGIVAAWTSMVGLAYAGVTLPSGAAAAFDKLGLSLPNQAQGSAAATDAGRPTVLPTVSPTVSPTASPNAANHGQTVSAAAKSGSGGCSFGQSIAAIAGSKRQDDHAGSHRQDASHRVNPCDQATTATEAGETEGEAAGSQLQAPGFGKDNHPSSDASGTHPTGNGTSTNPTGYGKESHPSDGASGRSTNPTGYGKESHPSA